MAEFTERVKLLIETVTEKATGDLHALKTKVDEADGGFSKLKTTAAGIGPALTPAIAAGVAGLAGLAVEAIHVADAFETAHAQLENVTANVGQNFEELKGSVDATDKSMEQLGFTNADTENAMARLTVATKDVQKSEELMGLAADIARARHIDLASATDILVKVEQGRYTQLVRMGVISKDQAADIHSTTDAIQILSGIYGGAAQANADTFAGKMEVLHATITDLTTQIGLALIPVVENMAQAFESTVSVMQSANDATDGFAGKVVLVSAGAVAAVVGISALVGATSALVDAISAATVAMFGFESSLGPVGIAIAAIGVAGAAVWQLMGQNESDAKKNTDDLNKALKEQKGLIENINLDRITSDFASYGDAMRFAGITNDELNKAMLGSSPAFAQVIAQLNTAKAAHAGNSDETKKLDDLTQHLTSSYDTYRKSNQDVFKTEVDRAQATGKLTDEQKRLFGALADGKTDQDRLAAAQALGVTTTDKLTGTTIDYGAAIDLVRKATGDATAATGVNTGALDDNTTSVDGNDKALKQQEKDIQAVIKALQTQEKALEGVSDAMGTTSDDTFAADQAGRALQQGLDDQAGKLKKINDEQKKGSIDAATAERQRQQVYADNAQLAFANATAQTNLAQANAEATGATFSHTQKIDTMNASLLTSVANFKGPLRQALIDHIAQINGIPPEKATEILANTNPQNLAEKGQELAAVSARRIVDVAVDLKQEQIDAAQAKLDELKVHADLTLPTVDAIMASADPATASFLTGGGTGGGGISIPASIEPTVDPVTKDAAETDLNSTANPPDGRSAKIAVQADLGTSKSDIDNVASNNGQGYHAVVHVSTAQDDKGPGKMTGGPVNQGGFYDVGEAGRERVFLPGGANVMTAGALMTAEAGGGGAVHVINLNVRVDPTVNLAQAGRSIADALEAYYRSSGSRRAYAAA